MKINRFYFAVVITVFIVMTIGIAYRLFEYDIYSKRVQFFCEYLIPGMEKEQVREILTSNSIYANESDSGDLKIWWLYSSHPQFQRVAKDIFLGFRNNKYTGASVRFGFDQSKYICHSDE